MRPGSTASWNPQTFIRSRILRASAGPALCRGQALRGADDRQEDRDAAGRAGPGGHCVVIGTVPGRRSRTWPGPEPARALWIRRKTPPCPRLTRAVRSWPGQLGDLRGKSESTDRRRPAGFGPALAGFKLGALRHGEGGGRGGALVPRARRPVRAHGVR